MLGCKPESRNCASTTGMCARGATGLGFNIKGGRDQPHVPRDPGIFVTKIREDGGAARDGRLQKGDKIVEINDKDVRNVLHQDAVNEFVNAGEKVVLVVQHGAEDILRELYATWQARCFYSEDRCPSCYKSYSELVSDSVSDIEDIELAAAVEASLQDTQPLNDDRNNEDVVRNIISKLAGRRSDGEPTTIVVHRKRLLASTMRAVSRPGFSFWTQVRIVFSGEDAEDGGGPRREYFNRLLKELQSSGIFENCEGRLSFKYDLQKISQRAYDMAGKLITWSLANGGPGLCSLSPLVFAAMVGQPVEMEDIRYLPDQMFQCNVEKLLGSKQEDFPSVIVELRDWLFDQGLTSVHKIDFADRDNLVKDLVIHQICHRVHSCIGQFTDGLGPLWEEVKGSPKACASLFIYDDHPLSVNVMRKLYKIEYSPPGSNNRNQEEDTIYCFEVFLQNCEDEITEVSLEDILEFWTGAPKPPPCGFSEDPKVSFYTAVSGIKRLPSSHTCGPVLWLPRGKEDPDEFQAMMRFAIKETQGFGKI